MRRTRRFLLHSQVIMISHRLFLQLLVLIQLPREEKWVKSLRSLQNTIIEGNLYRTHSVIY